MTTLAASLIIRKLGTIAKGDTHAILAAIRLMIAKDFMFGGDNG